MWFWVLLHVVKTSEECKACFTPAWGPFTHNTSLHLKTRDTSLRNGFKMQGSWDVLLWHDAITEITDNSQTVDREYQAPFVKKQVVIIAWFFFYIRTQPLSVFSLLCCCHKQQLSWSWPVRITTKCIIIKFNLHEERHHIYSQKNLTQT